MSHAAAALALSLLAPSPAAAAPVGYAWMGSAHQSQAKFGYAAGSAGDVNGDGFDDVIVGVPLWDNPEGAEGGAAVYYGSPVGLPVAPSWAAESNQPGAELGIAVASAGDVNGDGYDDVIIGAPGYANGHDGEGAAFVYLGSAGGLSAAPSWAVEGNQLDAFLGSSLAAAGDVDGDGYEDVLVGSFGPGLEGTVRLFLGSAAGLQATPAWTAVSSQDFDAFGTTIAAAGDVDGDGFDDVIVGAPYHDGGQLNEGRAFLYLGSAAGLPAVPSWIAESDQRSALFGVSVASAGDVNGDGFSDVIVGASSYRNGQVDEGGAFLYLGSAAGLALAPAWMGESNQARAGFGISVSSAGDVNGDGYDDVIVGADLYQNSHADEGGASLYLGSPTGLDATPAWRPTSNQADAHLGKRVAAAGDVDGDGLGDVLLAARDYGGFGLPGGAVFLFMGR